MRALPAAPAHDDHALLWINLETTGLDPSEELILEVAVQATTGKGRELAPLVSWTIQLDDARRERLSHEGNAVARRMHETSGLLLACAGGREARAQAAVEAALCMYIDAIGPLSTGKPWLAGCSVHFDRAFLAAHMPRVLDRLHYRQIDVTSLCEAWRLISGRKIRPERSPVHRAADDVLMAQRLYDAWGDEVMW